MAIALMRQIVTLFLMIGMGYLLVKLKVLKPTDSKVLSIISIYLVVPCVNLNAFQIDYTPEIMQGFLAAAVLSVIIHILLFLLGAVLKGGMHMSVVERMSIIYSNAGNLVIPLVTALLGSEYVIYSSAFICVQVLCLWTHGQSLMSGQKSFNWKKIFTNINLISALLGLCMFLAHLKLPSVIHAAVSSTAGMIAPISMIMIGMLIAGSDLKQIFSNRRIYLVAFMRLIAVPAGAVVILRLAASMIRIPQIDTIMMIVLLAVITPSASTVTQLAQFYDRDVEYCSAINVLTTLCCAVTMPLMIFLYTL